jgi:hypothetical protein
MEDDSTAVSLGAEKTCEHVIDTQFGSEQWLRDHPDRPGADLEVDLASGTGLRDFRLMAEAQIDGRQTGRSEPEGRPLDDPRRQRQPIRQADASCGARRDSSRSTAFIITDGVVSG